VAKPLGVSGFSIGMMIRTRNRSGMMKLSTWILVVLALGLGGVVYYLEGQDTSAPGESATARPIFTFQENQVQDLTIKTQQQTLRFVKVGQDRQAASTWRMQFPVPAPANDASVAYLLNLLATAKSDRTLTPPANQRQEFGLDQPQATVTVKLNNQETHQLVLGKPDFNYSFLYAQVDPPDKTPENLEVLLVPTAFEDAVKRPLSEWRGDQPQGPPAIDPN